MYAKEEWIREQIMRRVFKMYTALSDKMGHIKHAQLRNEVCNLITHWIAMSCKYSAQHDKSTRTRQHKRGQDA